MKNALLKRATAAALAGIMAISLASCGGGDTKPQTQQGVATDGKIFNTPTTVKIVITSSSSWPYQADWKIWKYFSEATGATFNIQAIPDTDASTKVNLLMTAQDTMPDLLYTDYKKTVDIHATSGAFISLSDHFDKLPNMTKFLDTLPEETRTELLRQRLSGDGKIYSAPIYGTHTIQNLRTWMYRKDVFEKNNLAVPTTMDEVYQVAKKLKALYPDSYPVCMRDGLRQFDPMAPQWKNNLNLYTYYDFKENKWCYGAQQPEIKEMIEYFLKLYDEQLVPPDYITINAKSWEELVSTDRGFIMLDYLVRLDFFNLSNRKDNPDYTWEIMEPPMADSASAQRKLAKTNVDYRGYVICNTGREDGVDNAFKLLDWMYTDEGSDLLSWGKEGETYEVVDGVRKFILPNPEETANQAYGVATTGLTQRIAVEANEASYSAEQQRQGHEAVKWNETNTNPTNWLAFDPAVEKDAQNLYSDCMNYTYEMISKFMVRQKPMSEWDSFQKGLKDMGVEQLLQYYADAYQNVTETKFSW